MQLSLIHSSLRLFTQRGGGLFRLPNLCRDGSVHIFERVDLFSERRTVTARVGAARLQCLDRLADALNLLGGGKRIQTRLCNRRRQRLALFGKRAPPARAALDLRLHRLFFGSDLFDLCGRVRCLCLCRGSEMCIRDSGCTAGAAWCAPCRRYTS